MTSSEKYYVERIAQTVRDKVEAAGIDISKPLKFESINAIVEYFGGELILKEADDNIDSDFYIKKIDENSFQIFYKFIDILKLLHELGHGFFDFPTMKENEIKCCDDIGLTDQKADLFARAFVMPRNDFENAMVQHITKDGKFDMLSLAESYGLNDDYMATMTRGEDLNLWT